MRNAVVAMALSLATCVFFLDAGTGDSHVPHDRGRGVLKLAQADRVEGSSITLDDVRQQVRGALVPAGGR